MPSSSVDDILWTYYSSNLENVRLPHPFTLFGVNQTVVDMSDIYLVNFKMLLTHRLIVSSDRFGIIDYGSFFKSPIQTIEPSKMHDRSFFKRPVKKTHTSKLLISNPTMQQMIGRSLESPCKVTPPIQII